jgi:hypothetical protein
MKKTPSWKPGQAVVLRGTGFGRLWWAMPVRVVQDTPELIALYWRSGTRWKDVSAHPSARFFLTSDKPELVDHVWTETDVLMLAVPGEAHSVWAMWEAGGGRLRCWYVNLETPPRRTRLGFDMMDQELDIVIRPDRSGWHWKDEAAFEEMTDVGVFPADEARAIRAEGERVIQEMRAGKSPFCDGWENWSPPANWSIPELPSGWDKL